MFDWLLGRQIILADQSVTSELPIFHEIHLSDQLFNPLPIRSIRSRPIGAASLGCGGAKTWHFTPYSRTQAILKGTQATLLMSNVIIYKLVAYSKLDVSTFYRN